MSCVHTMNESRAQKHTPTLFIAGGKKGNSGSGVGYVTHEPPLRMAEQSPAAKQSIYAFKMAARNATHPTPNLPSPRPTYTPYHLLPLSATVLTPVEFSTSLSRMPPKLFNFETQPLTANQPILPSSSREGVSLSLFFSFLSSQFTLFIRLSIPLLYLSRFFISLDPLFFSRISVLVFSGTGLVSTLKNDALVDR